jgi:hypothetical protein
MVIRIPAMITDSYFPGETGKSSRVSTACQEYKKCRRIAPGG